jgi:predicted aspartyl protease
MNKARVLAEVQRDYMGTYRAWETVTKQIVFGLSIEEEKALVLRANELRESLVGLRELHDRLSLISYEIK